MNAYRDVMLKRSLGKGSYNVILILSAMRQEVAMYESTSKTWWKIELKDFVCAGLISLNTMTSNPTHAVLCNFF